MPITKCGGCGKFLSGTAPEGVKCNKCSAVYHRLCVGLPTGSGVLSSWQCPECKKCMARDNRPDTPVRGCSAFLEKQSEETMDTSCLNSTALDTTEELIQDPGSEMKMLHLLMAEIKGVRADVGDIKKEIMQLRTLIDSCNSRLDSLESRVLALEKRDLQPPEQTTPSLNAMVEQLKQELNERDQDLLINDLEISNIPEASGENPVHLVNLVAAKLGVTLNEQDVVSAERIGGRPSTTANQGGDTVTRPRLIVVRMARRDLRDELLKSARTRRGATTQNLDLAGPPRRFYINERMTRTNHQLFRQARDAGRINGWQFVWTRRGRVLVRRKPGETSHRIRTEKDILQIMGPYV